MNVLMSDAANEQNHVSLAFDEVNSRFLVVWHDSRDLGTGWKLIETLTDPGVRSYDWTLPTVTATKIKCKVKVVLVDGAGNIRGKDTSDDVFTIDYLIH